MQIMRTTTGEEIPYCIDYEDFPRITIPLKSKIKKGKAGKDSSSEDIYNTDGRIEKNTEIFH